MAFKKDDLEKLSKLARIKIRESEEKEIIHHLSSMLNYMQSLKNVQIKNVQAPILSVYSNPLSEDIVETYDSSLFLSNAPERKGQMITIPNILNSEGNPLC